MVLGCGRSGTSIFGELFDGLADYSYASEPPFDNVIAADFSRPHAFKVPRESDRYLARPGLSFPLEILLAKAPDIKLFWIVRHPLDAICSLRIGIAKDWGHHPRPPDWREWLSRPLLGQCAHHWAFLNSAGYAQVAHVAHIVHFEAMIADPKAFAQGVCDILVVAHDTNAAHLGRWAARVQNTNNSAFIEAQTSRPYSRPDHEMRVGRWRENLSPAEVAQILPIVETAAARFGYALD
jgi:hypothetical protein